MTMDQPPGEEAPPQEPAAGYVFLAPDAVPARRNRMMAAGLAGVAVVILAIVVTLMLLIRYDNLPSLLSYFT